MGRWATPRRSHSVTRTFSRVFAIGMLTVLATVALHRHRIGPAPSVAAPSAHNAAQTWVREDDKVVFEAACECGQCGPDRADQATAVTDALDHVR